MANKSEAQTTMSTSLKHDIEKGPLVQAVPIDSPVTSPPPRSQLSPLATFQLLVGDVDAALNAHNEADFVHMTQRAEKRAQRYAILTSFLFGLLIATQIVLCLGITIGAQVGLDMMTISVLAGVNTVVAAGIAALKGLGLPDKKNFERQQLQATLEHVRYTTLKFKAGLRDDAEQAANELWDREAATVDMARVAAANRVGATAVTMETGKTA